MNNRKLTLLSPEIGNILVKQIAHELKNHHLYLSFANYFAIEGVTDLEEYYRKRAQEEHNHHQWIMDYLTDADFKFMYPAIEQNTETASTIMEPFRATVDREIQTTQMIYRIYELAISEKDYMTASWLSEKLIKEQIEEENNSRMALSIMEEDSSTLFEKADRVLDLLP